MVVRTYPRPTRMPPFRHSAVVPLEEQKLVQKAIESFGKALICDDEVPLIS